MGLVIRDDRQMKALTGVSKTQFDFLLSVFSHVYQAAEHKRYEEGLQSGQRSRKPGAGIKGKLPTMADKLQFVLYYYKTYPTFDVLGAQFDMGRSKANENLHKLSPILYDTLVQLELMPYRELETPKALRKALAGVDQLLIDATERAYRRSQDAATQREYYSGKKKTYAEKYRHVDAR
jgi:Helix-turn-helix of DDE superfamily endonuclease